jgi:glucose-1-phosphate thymidylyltransferase
VRSSNIPAERISAVAVVERDASGHLNRIVEKPSLEDLRATLVPILVSMNLWKFDSRIFDACRDVAPSARGELELPSALMLARERGVIFKVVPSLGPVLDLSSRADVAALERRLGEIS